MDQHGNLTVVGTDQGNVDGYLKSTGQAVYGTDFALPGCSSENICGASTPTRKS